MVPKGTGDVIFSSLLDPYKLCNIKRVRYPYSNFKSKNGQNSNTLQFWQNDDIFQIIDQTKV